MQRAKEQVVNPAPRNKIDEPRLKNNNYTKKQNVADPYHAMKTSDFRAAARGTAGNPKFQKQRQNLSLPGVDSLGMTSQSFSQKRNS